MALRASLSATLDQRPAQNDSDIRAPAGNHRTGVIYSGRLSGGNVMTPEHIAGTAETQSILRHLELARHMVAETGVVHVLVLRQNRYSVSRVDKVLPHDQVLEIVLPV